MRSRLDLHGYQEQALAFASVCERVGLFLSPGLGKTAISLTLISEQLRHGWLVVCPLRVMDTWQEEITKWAHLQGLTVARLHGKGKAQHLTGPQKNIYLINYEGLDWLYGQLNVMDRKLFPFRHIILDESQRVKDQSTNRWKRLRKMLPIFDRRILLTGTPLGGGGLQGLWTQAFVLDGGKALGEAFTPFQAKYFNKVSDYKWSPFPNTEAKLWAALDPHCMSMRALDLLDMPALTRNEIMVDLPASVRQQYKAIEDDFFLQLTPEHAILPSTAAATTNKLRQVAQGGIYDDEAHRWHPLHTAKLDALSDLVDELNGTPLLVLYQYRGEMEILQRMFPKAPVIAGGVSVKRGFEIQCEWNAGQHPVLLAHPKPVSLGLNLQKGGNNICWLAPTWSLDDHIQCEARLWRQGQDKGVVVHHIVARDTVDQAVMRALKSKDQTQAALIRALLAYRRKEKDYVM